ncbi:MAG: ISL3 family transposase, partial [Acidimicrobiales bacterium]
TATLTPRAHDGVVTGEDPAAKPTRRRFSAAYKLAVLEEYERCPAATLCIDAFHVVQWATDALDEVRRDVWNTARRSGMTDHARGLKGARFALWKNPEDLTRRQQQKLAGIAKANAPLYRAYLLKEQFRLAIRTKGVVSLTMLDAWLAWAARCRLLAFVELGRKIHRHLPGIEAAMLRGVSDALVESTNTKLRVLHRTRRLSRARASDRPRAPRPRRLLPSAARPRLTGACDAFVSRAGAESPAG